MATVVNKLAAERNQRLLLELVTKPGNDVCADCKARNPRWASYNLGIFICVSCASIHRKIGTHISKVKSLTLDSWTKEQVDKMKEIGNSKSNEYYNPNEVRNPPPVRLDDPARDNDLEQYIRSKYEYRRFVNKNALAASKLGPSRSASSMTPRTASAPVPAIAKPASTPPEPKTATDIAATMFSTTKPQLQPRAAPSQPMQHAPKPPVRSATHPVVSPEPPKPKPTGAKPEGVWADLISLQEPSANASLPLQYQSNTSTFTGLQPSNSMPAGISGMGTNPFGNMTGLSTAASFPQQPFGANPQQQGLQAQAPFPTSASTLPFQATTPQIPSSFNLSNSPNFLPQSSPAIPFYQPQPQQSSLTPSQSQPQFLSPSPNAQFLSPSPNSQFIPSQSPQLLSTTPTLQPNSTGFYPSHMTPSPQPMMSGMNGGMPGQVPQGPTMGMQQPSVFGGTGMAQSQQAPMNNPFGQMQFGQGGFVGQNTQQWGPL